ncbi:bifunctional phosphoribosyl-AMP cyclohydrolase/phosphoribosyl-ATP diphosphatase HisIE [Marinilactibacillus psychrotolerans]|uniref:Histidine biosynthesis bifunctional protein HisIE n=2 Tax=Marinilactibacillus psychrotolerans TaxID=191770 RepID=A0A5R9C1J9_9LACT|nr:bifunctional phosphoribosyl-AMP cyclohydrolase/phosphoribosyl-ATP diphosphatase HisIE [Marinilactibacillus psychrotolerans]TLQ06573.1 bifunctional phosphoribosyl-AMP cyclohydrolase/phosphoribosyl-ATP diphosphatase HisIE [Marinilactibacillus psychrotolerans]GEQ33216.1 phosphoribosyl-AMP cyclohydrolase / phosphoribosyl-ATP pyrophosphatase [Marinilactibacillus psychrotolerans]SJN24852.1 Phosphoribosyl-AMP cyclohydrolase / Phosphoribosyl-ATP pyrophosphatase [Marinilactibacillus psychrotolerans 42
MSKYDKLKPDFSKGLLTVILQHYTNKEIRMVGYMNEEAFELTKQEEVAWFYSRSKERLWKKGESSGNVQYVKDMYLDCDQDALLVMVDPAGPTCHTGTDSCFNLDSSFTLKDIEATIQNRAASSDNDSYTNYLLSKGIDKIAKKFGEEAFEVVIGAKNKDKEEITNEAADVLYHLGVLLHHSGVSVSEVESVLANRHKKQNNFKGERKDVQEW